MEKARNTGSIALGQYLMAKRAASGMSLRQMADRIGKAASTIQSWEQGKRMPNLEDLFVLSNVLNADVNELITLAATPLKELEKRLTTVQSKYKKILIEAAKLPATESSKTQPKLREITREMTFLHNLIAGRKKHQTAWSQIGSDLAAEHSEAQPTKALPHLEPIQKTKKVPLLGTIAAGRPRLAVQNASEYTDVPEDLNVTYALQVTGDSMVGAGIDPGDEVWVKAADTAEPGETVVVLLGGEEVTVKHLIKENGRYLLRPNNPYRDYPDIPLRPEDKIIGVVKRVVKRPGPPPRR